MVNMSIRDMLRQRFNVPVAERSRLQKSALVKFWRLKNKLSVDSDENLLYDRKKVVRKGDIQKVVKKTFKKNKSGGHRKLRSRAADGYSGSSKLEILKVTKSDPTFHRFNVRFNNKAAHTPVLAKKVFYLHKYCMEVYMAVYEPIN